MQLYNIKQSAQLINKCELIDTDLDHIWSNLIEFTIRLCSSNSAVFALTDGDEIIVQAKSASIDDNEMGELNLLLRSLMKEAIPDNQFKSDSFEFYDFIKLFNNDQELIGFLLIIHSDHLKISQEDKTTLKLLMNQTLKTFNLKCNRDDYRRLVETSRDIIYELNEDGKFIFVNSSGIQKLGYSFEEFQRMDSCWDLIEVPLRQKIKDHYLSKLKSGETSIYHEFPVISKTGKEIWLGQSVDYTLVDDRVVRSHVIAKDVTELINTRKMLKETEEQILAEKTLLKTMVFSSPAAIAMFSKDLTYLAFSEKWMQDKYINEQTMGLGDAELTPERVDFLASSKSKILAGETVSSEGDLILDEDGNERWVKWVATPWNNTTDGSIGGVMLYANDITQNVKHAKELKKAKEEALELGKMKEEFLSSMSHEIRTPLNAIIGTTNLILEENTSLREDEKFKLLQFSSNNLLSLINNVLDYSKIESGNIILEKNDYNLHELCVNLVNSWKPIAIKKGVNLMLKWDESTSEIVIGDKIRLSQILNNLINNALKFTTEGFVYLKVSTGSEGQIQFEVKDTGIGIPEHMHKSVFQSFQQVKNELTLESGGTGLGLPICERLLKMMDSKLELESREGLGSRFFFSIALESGSKKLIDQVNEGVGEVSLNLNVLLVEDNRANQFIAESFLKKWCVTFKVASNGEEAVKWIKNKSFDAILMDMRMPVMDGRTATKMIRNMEGDYFKKVPIIALTASTIMDLRKEESDHLFDDYLSKPFNPEDFLNILYKISNSIKNDEKVKTINLPNNPSKKNDLKMNLEKFTEGDKTFLIEFVKNIIGNVDLLKEKISNLSETSDVYDLGEVIHMVKPTLEILGEPELTETLYDIKSDIQEQKVYQSKIKKALESINGIHAQLNGILNEGKKKELLKAS